MAWSRGAGKPGPWQGWLPVPVTNTDTRWVPHQKGPVFRVQCSVVILLIFVIILSLNLCFVSDPCGNGARTARLEPHLKHDPASPDRFSVSCSLHPPLNPPWGPEPIQPPTTHPCPMITATLLPCQGTVGRGVGRSDQDQVHMPNNVSRQPTAVANSSLSWQVRGASGEEHGGGEPLARPPCMYLASPCTVVATPLRAAGLPWAGAGGTWKGETPGSVSPWHLPSDWLEGNLAA